MIVSQNKNGQNRLLVYNESVLMPDKDDNLTFIIENENLNYKIRFTFSQEGEKYSTTFWEDSNAGYLHYQLNNWDSSTYVEVTKPVELKVLNSDSKFWMKFRNQSLENKNHRKFQLSIWKEIE
ncbi:DUF6864 domain-containing function [Ancylomarina longa]|uniref:Uncharacterized protein n=1 Tax=Ancylomarina longa TaxID=2487017 RepID=A0A434AX60_9BACT|nr:hypothetical protein [Ancylomarina longa]RUT79111.1 hypothetical protein DLK05_04645 [Ancylomarina longa]